MTTHILTTADDMLSALRATYLSPALSESQYIETDAAIIDLHNECVRKEWEGHSAFLDCEITVHPDANRAREAVERGIAVLDDLDEDWQGRIDVDALDIPDGNDCVLAQVYGASYGLGALDEFWISLIRAGRLSWHDTISEYAFRHGFNTIRWSGGVQQAMDGRILTLAWKLALSPS